MAALSAALQLLNVGLVEVSELCCCSLETTSGPLWAFWVVDESLERFVSDGSNFFRGGDGGCAGAGLRGKNDVEHRRALVTGESSAFDVVQRAGEVQSDFFTDFSPGGVFECIQAAGVFVEAAADE